MDNTNTTNQHQSPPPPPDATTYPPQQPTPYHHLLEQQNQQLQMFWNYQRNELETTNDFKNHQLPLARIKKIMKADEDVRMISAEAPILFEKACELFILELTIRSWFYSEQNKRRTLHKNDIASAITTTDIFDFLLDIVPPTDDHDHDAGPSMMIGSGVFPCYYGPTTTTLGQPMIGRPVVDHPMYQQAPSQAWQSVRQSSKEDVSYATSDGGGGGSGPGGNVDG